MYESINESHNSNRLLVADCYTPWCGTPALVGGKPLPGSTGEHNQHLRISTLSSEETLFFHLRNLNCSTYVNHTYSMYTVQEETGTMLI